MGRLLAIIAPIVLMSGLVIGFTSSAAHATPAVEVCSNQGGSSQCMNRDGGGIGTLTKVIGWSAGDNNNDFEFLQITEMCGNGYVKSTKFGDSENCPFANTALDALNWKYAIVEFEAYDEDLCVGNPNSSGGGSVLTQCPDAFGNGGGWATINVLVGVSDFPNWNGSAKNVQNRRWSDVYNQDRWVCFQGHGAQLTLAGQTPLNGACQIAQI